MKKNMSRVDGIVRFLLAATAAILFFTNVITGTLGIVLMIAGGIFLLTSFVSFCPIYAVFGISSCKVPSKSS